MRDSDVHSGRLFILDVERNLTRSVVLREPRPDCTACGGGGGGAGGQANTTAAAASLVQSTDYVHFCGAPSNDKVSQPTPPGGGECEPFITPLPSASSLGL